MYTYYVYIYIYSQNIANIIKTVISTTQQNTPMNYYLSPSLSQKLF